MKLKSNKKLLNVRLREITGKNITLRDLTNMGSNMKKTSHRNDLVELVERLNAMPGKYNLHFMLSAFVLMKCNPW